LKAIDAKEIKTGVMTREKKENNDAVETEGRAFKAKMKEL
tara:strand:- start:527 stop:646 length:120 start_codon:yes stop_codon:yes gene_type:complete